MPRLSELAAAQKTMSSALGWSSGGGFSAGVARLSADGYEDSEMQLRVKAPHRANRHGLLVQVEYKRGERDLVKLERIDWKTGHGNGEKGPAALRLLTMDSTHWHRFEINYKEDVDEMLSGNLPIAQPVLPDPDSVNDLLNVCEQYLKVSGVSSVQLPPYQAPFVAR